MNPPRASSSNADGAWLWLFPASQLIHAAEEWWGGFGFHRWAAQIPDQAFSSARVAAYHAVVFLLLVCCVVIIQRITDASRMIPMLAVLLLLNATIHVIGSLIARGYTPGLLSALVLWVPLGATAMRRGWRAESPARFWLGAMIGLAVQVPITWVALRAGRVG